MARYDVIREIGMKVATMIEGGTVPWTKPWRESDRPRNATTGKAYRGVNLLALTVAHLASGYTDPRWCTLRQANALGGRVIKGARGTSIVFWKPVATERDGEEKRYTLARGYTVFNVEQVEGVEFLPLPGPSQVIEPVAAAQAIADGYLARGPSISHGAGLAAYSASSDHVLMPAMCEFVSAERYHATLFHELTHSTGHSSRLGRDLGVLADVHSYSREELVAEWGAAFLCGHAGIATDDVVEQSASYLLGWASKIREEPGVLAKASSDAQRAVDLILGSEVAA